MKKKTVDIAATLFLWIYFTLGYLLIFMPAYLLVYFSASDREVAFQRINHLFFGGFFTLAQLVIPGFQLWIDPAVTKLRGSVIVCNHVSYFDPLLLISLFKKQKTIVKSTFFAYPFLSWNIKSAGYLPSSAAGVNTERVYKGISSMADYLLRGGNLFIFPEGTRRTDGQIGHFNKGAFSIARKCRAPIRVIKICNTDHLFSPGHALLNTCIPNRVTVTLIGSVEPLPRKLKISTSKLMQQTRHIFDKNAAGLNRPEMKTAWPQHDHRMNTGGKF